MSTTTDASTVTLSAYATGRLRELLADRDELSERIDVALADGLSAEELFDDRRAIDVRIVWVLRHDMTSGQPA